MNRARKGRELEHRARKLLEQEGYDVVRSAASLGTWDLIAIPQGYGGQLRAVQVRANRRPRSPELARMRAWKTLHPAWRCEVWVWCDRGPLEIEVL